MSDAKIEGKNAQLQARADATRIRWLETLQAHKHDDHGPGSERFWSPRLDTASRDEIIAIQNAKLTASVPFLYENSSFYRRRFERLGMIPDDIRGVGDLAKWPIVTKAEMMEDVARNPPFGTYTTLTEERWRSNGWKLFSSSGSTGTPRVFCYSQFDREMWAWANARALYSMNIRRGDVVLMVGGFGPHVWLWGVEAALAKMGVATIPGGGMDGKARAGAILRFKPTVLTCTPSYALHLGRVLEEMGEDPAKTAIKTIFVGGEPVTGIPSARQRIESLWGAKLVEFYGCTEAAPHSGGYSCPSSTLPGEPSTTHLMEDVGVWEAVSENLEPVGEGERGLTVCTNLNSESSPQLRFMVGDYAIYDRSPCSCGRTHVRAIGGFAGRVDDLINLRGIKLYPVQIEDAVRSIADVGDEYEILLQKDSAGMDIMTVRVEHADPGIAGRVAAEIRSRCEVRVDVDVIPYGSLPKTEFKARRVRDLRPKT